MEVAYFLWRAFLLAFSISKAWFRGKLSQSLTLGPDQPQMLANYQFSSWLLQLYAGKKDHICVNSNCLQYTCNYLSFLRNIFFLLVPSHVFLPVFVVFCNVLVTMSFLRNILFLLGPSPVFLVQKQGERKD